ncbi:MAG: LuxR C-terminal-related transcriptional regulator [Sandaracinaceae bacterium]|nr:LuxR C-terminal-related transcriptional regulator [Sandaracinaceae bacterium]
MQGSQPPPGTRVVDMASSRWVVLSVPVEGPATLEPAARTKLTAAVQEVALHLLAGSSLSEIAAARRTTLRTVSKQACAIYAKLGVHSRSELVAAYLRRAAKP